MDLAEPAFWLPILQIVWIDVLLSGDNALVIALACRSLPEERRRLGLFLGSCAAIALRIAFTLLIAELFDVPFIRIAGGIVLLWIAITLAGPEASHKEIESAKTLWSAVRIIATADVIMSFDNMLAVVAVAKGSILLILFGLALSIPLLMFGSSLRCSSGFRCSFGLVLSCSDGSRVTSSAPTPALRRWHRSAAEET